MGLNSVVDLGSHFTIPTVLSFLSSELMAAHDGDSKIRQFQTIIRWIWDQRT